MSPDQRNVNATVEYGEPRTNNASEGGNNSLNHTTSATRPTIWTLLKTLRQVNAKKDALFFQIQQNGYHCEMRKRGRGGKHERNESGISLPTMTLVPSLLS